MPVLAGWLTGEQVPNEAIEQTLGAMEKVLALNGGKPARIVQPGMGLVTFSDATLVMQRNDEPPVLDWVPSRRTFVYRRPLSGLHPLYYIENWPAQGNLLFASEIKALLVLGVARELHVAALDALLRFGYVPAPWTMFKSISIVPAGSILRWQHAKTVVSPSTDFQFEPSTATSPEDTAEQIKTLLIKHTANLLPPHEQWVVLTNSDMPSALIALVASQVSDVEFTFVNYDYKDKEVPMWRGVSRLQLGVQRPLFTIVGHDDPEFWRAVVLQTEAPCVDTRPVALHQLLYGVKKELGVRVALSGLGGGTLLGKRKALPKRIRPVFSQDFQQRIQQEARWEDTLHARRLQRRAEQFESEAQKQYYLDLHTYLPDSVVQQAVQIAAEETMALRSPYLKSDVMTLLTQLNASLRNETFLSAIHIKDFDLIEDKQMELQLQLSVPSLLHIEESELLQAVLSREAIQARGIFDVERVEGLLKQKSVSRELIFVVTTQLFCEMFDVEIQ
jgi:asparagine synthetase B (glutamine-hydrolysing)